MKWVLRIAAILVAAFIIAANNLQQGEGTTLGFYPLDSAERLGFDIAKGAIDVVAFFIVYRGFRTTGQRKKVEPST